tara:strand:+ start:15022 stop:16212 length:1191 start_codon:yes stop_codon:yes gene_type:complete
MAGNTFYTKNAKKASKASNSFRSKENSNDLPGLAYSQGHSIRNIFSPRGLLPVIGRDGYKTIVSYRVEGGSSNRTIFQTEDTRENNYFVDSDRLIPARFKITHTVIESITKENYSSHITSIKYPNGDIANLADLNQAVVVELISSLVDKLTNFYELIIVPENLKGKPDFRGYGTIRFGFDTKQEAQVDFPNGGLTQVPNFSIMTEVYGDNGDYQKDTPYTDLMKFDPVAWIRESGPPGMYPDVTPSSSYNTSLFNGIIEPFKIRTEIYDLDIFAKTDEVRPNSVNGACMPNIKNYTLLSENNAGGISPVIDIGNYKSAGSVLDGAPHVIPSYYSPDPFLEKDKFVGQYIDDEIKAILSVVSLNPGILPVDAVSQSTGYDCFASNSITSANYRGRLR